MDREISGTKNVYFCDNGLLNQFSRVSDGNLPENAVFLNLRKYGTLNYYQRRTGTEIDFILKGKLIALEVKMRGTAADYHKLSKVSASLRYERTLSDLTEICGRRRIYSHIKYLNKVGLASLSVKGTIWKIRKIG
ncbi:MAG: DUF4143 domain-containing protein [Candidatus Marinimicrobia bacterium]|nr:DUF4143 domain-containing protein [Candidatus Neomarinimicrobiota bacterium]